MATNKIYEEKRTFCNNSLKSLLIDADKNILDVYYKYKDCEEIVTVSFKSGSTYNVHVNGDSLLAIVNDVTKQLLK